MRLNLTGLWQNADFLRLWVGQTISVFGSIIGATAMSFTAILFLGDLFAGALGIRLILAVGAGSTVLPALVMALSPLRRLKEAPSC